MVKIPCQVCQIKGTLQKVGNNYYRIRHYDGSFNKKLKFHYHQNTKAHALQELEKLRQQNKLVNTIFEVFYQNTKNNKVNIDLKQHKQHNKQQNSGASSSVRIEQHPPKPKKHVDPSKLNIDPKNTNNIFYPSFQDAMVYRFLIMESNIITV